MVRLAEFIGLCPSKSTAKSYRSGIRLFLDFIYGKQRAGKKCTPEEDTCYEELADRYLKEKHDHLSDLAKFAVSLKNIPPFTARNAVAYTRLFLENNGIDLKEKEKRMLRLKLPKGGARTIELDLDAETLKTLTHHLDIKGRALVLVLATSGMRIAEALQITLDSINFDSQPCEITIRGEYTKTGNIRYTYITDEAREAVREWLKVREQFIKSAQKKNAGLVKKGYSNERPAPENDRRLFPFGTMTANQVWTDGLKRAGLYSRDNGTGRSQLHVHQCRKFFSSQLRLKAPVDIVEMMMGHAGYLSDSYRRYTKQQVREYYEKGQGALAILSSADIRELKEKDQQKDTAISAIAQENQMLKIRLAEMEKQMAAINALEGVRANLTPADHEAIAALIARELKPGAARLKT